MCLKCLSPAQTQAVNINATRK